MGFESYYRNAIKISERLGTWVLYAVRDARSLDLLIGYMAYTIDDLDHLKKRARSENTRAHYSQLIGTWRRAVRFVSSLDRVEYAVLAERILEHLNEHPEHRDIPFCVSESGHRAFNTKDRPPRRAGRPRTRSSSERPVKTCGQCGGLGRVAR